MCKILCLNSKRLLRKLQKILGGYFFLPHPVDSIFVGKSLLFVGAVFGVFEDHGLLMAQHCSVIGCSNGRYKLEHWKKKICPLHKCNLGCNHCICDPPFRYQLLLP